MPWYWAAILIHHPYMCCPHQSDSRQAGCCFETAKSSTRNSAVWSHCQCMHVWESWITGTITGEQIIHHTNDSWFQPRILHCMYHASRSCTRIHIASLPCTYWLASLGLCTIMSTHAPARKPKEEGSIASVFSLLSGKLAQSSGSIEGLHWASHCERCQCTQVSHPVQLGLH